MWFQLAQNWVCFYISVSMSFQRAENEGENPRIEHLRWEFVFLERFWAFLRFVAVSTAQVDSPLGENFDFGHWLRTLGTLIRRKPKKIILSVNFVHSPRLFAAGEKKHLAHKWRSLLGTPIHCPRWFGGSRKKLFGHELRFRGSITLPLPDLPLYWCQVLFLERFWQFKDFGQILGIAGFSWFWEICMTVWQTDTSTTWWNIS